MEVTLIPRDCKRTPKLLMEIPFPKPLTTPPVTIRYFIAFWYELFVASVRKRVGKRIPTIWERRAGMWGGLWVQWGQNALIHHGVVFERRRSVNVLVHGTNVYW